MAEELHDLRTKVPLATLSVMQALEMATGKNLSEIARDWLIAAATEELHKATVIARVMRGKGGDGAPEGNP